MYLYNVSQILYLRFQIRLFNLTLGIKTLIYQSNIYFH